MKKVILITGASSGFGEGIATKLLATGKWTVYAAARRTEKMLNLEKKGAKILKMDVSSQEQIDSGISHIIEKEGKIDVLLSNAGYGSYGMIENIDLEEIKYQYEVNVFGTARLLKAILPNMRKRKSGRIILTTSLVSNISMMGIGWYASTKHALRAVGVALRQEVKDLGIDVVMIEPGGVKTEFADVALDAIDKVNHPSDYSEKVESFKKYIREFNQKSPNAESTVECMYKAITNDKPQPIYRTTLDAKVLPKVKSILGEKLYDRIVKSQMLSK